MSETAQDLENVTIPFTTVEALDIMLCAAERSIDPVELIRQATFNDLYR